MANLAGALSIFKWRTPLRDRESALARSIAAGDRTDVWWICLMAECIVLSLAHLLDTACQVQARCHSFSNANRKDLGITFIQHPASSSVTSAIRMSLLHFCYVFSSHDNYLSF